MAQDQPAELHLRVTWGGGAARRWEGRLRIDNGELSDLRYLGLDADESATIYLDPKSASPAARDAAGERHYDCVQIKQTAPRDIDGFDIRVRGVSRQTSSWTCSPWVKTVRRSLRRPSRCRNW